MKSASEERADIQHYSHGNVLALTFPFSAKYFLSFRYIFWTARLSAATKKAQPSFADILDGQEEGGGAKERIAVYRDKAQLAMWRLEGFVIRIAYVHHVCTPCCIRTSNM
jgi:hypothetical protein